MMFIIPIRPRSTKRSSRKARALHSLFGAILFAASAVLFQRTQPPWLSSPNIPVTFGPVHLAISITLILLMPFIVLIIYFLITALVLLALPSTWTSTPTPGLTGTPVISALAARSGPASGTFTVRWTTDMPASTEVAYGVAPTELSMWVSNSALTTAHTMTITALPHARYFYYARSANSAGTATSPTSRVTSR